MERKGNRADEVTASVPFFKKYFILRGQNAIIVSKDYSKTDGKVSSDEHISCRRFLFI